MAAARDGMLEYFPPGLLPDFFAGTLPLLLPLPPPPPALVWLGKGAPRNKNSRSVLPPLMLLEEPPGIRLAGEEFSVEGWPGGEEVDNLLRRCVPSSAVTELGETPWDCRKFRERSTAAALVG